MQPIITPDVLFFFDGKPYELSLYEAFAQRVLERYPNAEIKVRKTQISFYEGRMFACVSMTPVRRKAERPEHFITVTFGLDHPLEDARAVVVPVRPNRFTHHVIIGEAGEIDDQLMAWIDMGKRMK
jgi:hypothetical protein